MGKSSGKKRSLAQAGRQGNDLAEKRKSEQAGKLTDKQENKPVTGREPHKLESWKGHLFIIAVIAFLAYSNTFHSPFQLDEADFITDNPIIRNLGYFSDISRAKGLPVYDGLKSRYIGYLTFALNYKIHGFNVMGYHIVNLAIHLINAILVYFLVLLTFKTLYFRIQQSAFSNQSAANSQQSTDPQSPVPGSYSPFTAHYSRFLPLAVALLFVSHPIQTEAVTYVFQRFASLVSMFYLLSLVLYIKGRLARYQAGKLASYFFALVCAVLAMKTKENASTLPPIIMLYEFLFFTGPLKPRVVRLLPFFLTMLIVPLTIMATGGTPGEIISQVKDPVSQGFITPTPEDYLLTQFRVIVTYIRLLLLPVNQNLDYAYPLYRSFFALPVFLSFVFLASLLGAAGYLVYKTHGAQRTAQSAISNQQSAVRSKKEKDSGQWAMGSPPHPPLANGGKEDGSLVTMHYLRLIAFGILWFFITQSVESSIIPIPMLIDEYRVYLPSVGFFLALVASILLFLEKISLSTIHYSLFTRVAAAVLAVIILAHASATYARNILWKERTSLWEDIVSKSPRSSRAHNNLGIAYYDTGRYDEAIRMYEHAVALNPQHLDAYMNLGVVYAVTGHLDSAIERFSYVAARDPKNSAPYLNMGRAYSDLGRPHEAIENFLRAIAVNPTYSGAFHGLGTAYARLGRLDEALAAFTRFVQLSPHDPEAYGNRGLIYLNKGDVNSALADFQQACSLGNKASCRYMERLR